MAEIIEVEVVEMVVMIRLSRAVSCNNGEDCSGSIIFNSNKVFDIWYRIENSDHRDAVPVVSVMTKREVLNTNEEQRRKF